MRCFIDCLVVAVFFSFLRSRSFGLVVHEYLGCFADSASSRLLTGYESKYYDLTYQACNTLCFTKGYKFAGTENGNECYCGDIFDIKATAEEDSACNRPCSGSEKFTCGGWKRLAVYATAGFDEVSEISNAIGCLSDSGDTRLISEHKIDLYETNSPQRCISICNNIGFPNAGLKNSYECYCGRAKKTGPFVRGCDMKCPSNESLFCGGKGKIMVYRTDSPAVPPPKIDYVGCYKNVPGGILKGSQQIIDEISPLKCISQCFSLGFFFVGILNSTECQCGGIPTYPPPETVADSFCSMKCPGDAARQCGSSTHVSGYSTGVVGDPILGKSIGCFEDEGESILNSLELIIGYLNSPKLCILKCLEHSFPYAGVKDRTLCKCGYSQPDLTIVTQVPDRVCNLSCPNLSSQNCGGFGYIYVYRTGLDHLFRGITVSSCEKSETLVKGKKVCRNRLIFKDNFNSLNTGKWEKTVQISGEDGEFVTYMDNEENVFIKDGNLVIKPTIFEESFITNGQLKLNGCTGKAETDECQQIAKSFAILPPVKSAQLCTKETFSFKYGSISVRAKFPSGDWVVPQIWLKPVKEIYGPKYMSGKMYIVSVGNEDLKSSNGEELGSKILTSGLAMSHNEDGFNLRHKFVVYKSEEPWNSQFHTYTLMWEPDKITFFYDGESSVKKTIYKENDGVIADIMNLSTKNDVWKSSTFMAPFDQEFYICLGVSVGGSRNFEDDSLSRRKRKPWKNWTVKSLLNYWLSHEDWESTWSEKTQMEIDSVTVTAL